YIDRKHRQGFIKNSNTLFLYLISSRTTGRGEGDEKLDRMCFFIDSNIINKSKRPYIHNRKFRIIDSLKFFFDESDKFVIGRWMYHEENVVETKAFVVR